MGIVREAVPQMCTSLAAGSTGGGRAVHSVTARAHVRAGLTHRIAPEGRSADARAAAT